jgi:hypothetical protein
MDTARWPTAEPARASLCFICICICWGAAGSVGRRGELAAGCKSLHPAKVVVRRAADSAASTALPCLLADNRPPTTNLGDRSHFRSELEDDVCAGAKHWLGWLCCRFPLFSYRKCSSYEGLHSHRFDLDPGAEIAACSKSILRSCRGPSLSVPADSIGRSCRPMHWFSKRAGSCSVTGHADADAGAAALRANALAVMLTRLGRPYGSTGPSRLRTGRSASATYCGVRVMSSKSMEKAELAAFLPLTVNLNA